MKKAMNIAEEIGTRSLAAVERTEDSDGLTIWAWLTIAAAALYFGGRFAAWWLV